MPGRLRTVVTFTAGLFVAGCGSTMNGPVAPGSAGTSAPIRASVQLQPTQGSFVIGSATFVQIGDKVVVSADVRGLPANAQVGFHVHEKGDCSAPDAASAGGHFNPLSHRHGPQTAEHHAGDMPNLRADATGRAIYRVEVDSMSIADGPSGIVGRALIVHRDTDDYTSQPAGNAGPRLACGVIQRSS